MADYNPDKFSLYDILIIPLWLLLIPIALIAALVIFIGGTE